MFINFPRYWLWDCRTLVLFFFASPAGLLIFWVHNTSRDLKAGLMMSQAPPLQHCSGWVCATWTAAWAGGWCGWRWVCRREVNLQNFGLTQLKPQRPWLQKCDLSWIVLLYKPVSSAGRSQIASMPGANLDSHRCWFSRYNIQTGVQITFNIKHLNCDEFVLDPILVFKRFISILNKTDRDHIEIVY